MRGGWLKTTQTVSVLSTVAAAAAVDWCPTPLAEGQGSASCKGLQLL